MRLRHGLRLILFCTLAILSVPLKFETIQAQQVPESSYQALSDKFFDLLRAGKSTEAVDLLFGTNPEMQKLTDESQQLKTQFSSLGPLMGSYISQTKLIETKVAGMFVYQHYFVAYQRQPISVRIEYYKPGSKWICYGLQFDGKLTEKIKALSDDKIAVDTK